jgi:hypothetical protein
MMKMVSVNSAVIHLTLTKSSQILLIYQKVE